jgi:hypothetical protein
MRGDEALGILPLPKIDCERQDEKWMALGYSVLAEAQAGVTTTRLWPA